MLFPEVLRFWLKLSSPKAAAGGLGVSRKRKAVTRRRSPPRRRLTVFEGLRRPISPSLPLSRTPRAPRRAHGDRQDGGGRPADSAPSPPGEPEADRRPVRHAPACAEPRHAPASDPLRGAPGARRRRPTRGHAAEGAAAP